ncbi:MAG: L,D-transpeptidase [Candidatus Binatia bacterium]
MKILDSIGVVVVLLTVAIVATSSASGSSVGKGSNREAILGVQVQLDRAAFPVGEIDGRWGANTERAIRAFQRARDLAPSGTVDDATAAALEPEVPALVAYTITADDVAGPFVAIPKDMMAKAKLPAAGFASPLEMLAERAHASPALLRALNPGKAFDAAGTEVKLPNVGGTAPAPGKSIVVDGSDLSVQVLDEQEKVIARYPASVGSVHDPLPVGRWTIKGVARNPKFHYDPDLFWDADRADTEATIPPGPNNPVGVVWIDLSKEHYGIHGTPEPSRISRSESHGCIRLTNWDAATLAEQVKPGTPAVLRE